MLQSIETHSSSSHSLGCYIALANILRGCYLSDTERNIGDIKVRMCSTCVYHSWYLPADRVLDDVLTSKSCCQLRTLLSLISYLTVWKELCWFQSQSIHFQKASV